MLRRIERKLSRSRSAKGKPARPKPLPSKYDDFFGKGLPPLSDLGSLLQYMKEASITGTFPDMRVINVPLVSHVLKELNPQYANMDKLDLVMLLASGADLEAVDAKKARPLHYAVQHGHPDAVRLLLEKGADPNAADMDRRTPLHYAVSQNAETSVRLLLAYGARTDKKDVGGKRALDHARTKRMEKLLQK